MTVQVKAGAVVLAETLWDPAVRERTLFA